MLMNFLSEVNWWQLFAYGTVAFWVLFVCYSALLVLLMESEKFILSGIATFGTLAAILLLGNKAVLPWICSHPWYYTALSIVIYILGIVIPWAIVKWWFYVHSIDEFINEKLLDWITNILPQTINSSHWEGSRSIPDFTSQQKEDFKQTIATRTLVGDAIGEWDKFVDKWEEDRRRARRDGRWKIPKPLKRPRTMAEIETFVEDNKGRIISWMTYCPWSILWTLINDPIRKLMKQLFRLLRSTLRKIAARVFNIPVVAN